MSDRLLEPRELPPRSRAIALLLLGAVVLCAGVGELHFSLARAARDVQVEHLRSQRSAALIWDVLALAATVALCRWTRRWRLGGWPGSRRWMAALAVVLCGAAALRLYRLAELPPGLWVDEALNGVQAVQIAATGQPLVALPPEDVRTGLGAGYVDVAGAAFALFDPIDGPYALRAVTVAIGTLGVAALAALAWTLFGARVALAASAWIAVSQWHINYSRWGEMPIMSSVVETVIVLATARAFLARGWRAWGWFLIAGAFAGGGMYTYQTFRLFAVLAGTAGLLLAIRCAPAIVARWRPTAAALVLAALVAAPMLRYAVAQPEDFGERAQGTLIFGRADWWEQLRDAVPSSLFAFQLLGDDNPRHNLPFAPLLSPLPALLAPIGLAVCLARWRALPYALVPVWFAIGLVPGMITLEAPHASRLLDAIVSVALMIGIAVDLLLGVLQAALPPRIGTRLGAVALLLAAAWTAVAEYRAYFVERSRLPEFVDAFAPWESAPGRYLAAHVPSATVYLDPSTYWSPATWFVAHRYLDTLPNDVRMLRLQHDFPPLEPLARDVLYLLPRPYAPLAAVIRALWADAECEETRDAFGRIDLVACRVSPASLAAVRARTAAGAMRWPYGLRGRFYQTTDAGAPAAEGVLAFPYCEYRLDEPPLGRFRHAEWDGFIDIAQPGDYYFRLHPDSTTLTIDGRTVIADAGARAFGGGNEGRVTLPAGRLPIRITLDPGPEERYFLWFLWQPPHHEVEIVPAQVLHPPNDG
jgi:hypothetical protein